MSMRTEDMAAQLYAMRCNPHSKSEERYALARECISAAEDFDRALNAPAPEDAPPAKPAATGWRAPQA